MFCTEYWSSQSSTFALENSLWMEQLRVSIRIGELVQGSRVEESSLLDFPVTHQNSSVTINVILSWTKMRPKNALHSQFWMFYYLTSKEKIQRLFYLPSMCMKLKGSSGSCAKLSDVGGRWLCFMSQLNIFEAVE